MSVSTPPPPVPSKKKGWGCFGCGCLVLIAIVALILALCGLGGYSAYHKILANTSNTPASVPTPPVTDDFYQSVVQKVEDFSHDVKNHQPASLQLSSDEINALLMRDPYLSSHNAKLFIVLSGDEASIQGSIPCDSISSFHGFSGRYANFSGTTGITFDSTNHSLSFPIHTLEIGDKALPQNAMPLMQAESAAIVNPLLLGNPDIKDLLAQAKSIRIANGNFIVETQ